MSARPWIERAIAPGTETTELYVYLPDDEYSARRWLRRVLGKGIPIERVRRHGVPAWKLAASHMIPLVGSIAHAYGPTKVRLEITRVDEGRTIEEQCDTRCQTAKVTRVWDCVCACGGKYHGNGRDPHSWYPVGRTTLVRGTKTQIEQLILVDGQLPDVKKVPRPSKPRPAAMPQARLPHPTSTPIQPVSPRPAPTAPRTAIPAAGRFGDPDRWPIPAVSAPPTTAAQASTPVRRRVGGPLVAAMAAIVAVTGGLWLTTHLQPEANRAPDQETTPPSATSVELPPPPAEEQLPAPVDELPAPMQPQLPAGCYPFQTGC